MGRRDFLTALHHLNISCVIFDWDETLLNSISVRRAILRDVLDLASINVSSEEILGSLGGTSLETYLDNFEIKRGRTPSLYKAYRKAYWFKEHKGIALYHGILDMLTGLRNKQIRMGIVTQKISHLNIEGRVVGVLDELKELRIDTLFGAVVGYDDVVNPKPHPEPVQLALKQLKALPENTLLVGDSRADIQSGKSAGCTTCHAIWGTQEKDLAAVGANFVVSRPEQILDIVSGRSEP